MEERRRNGRGYARARPIDQVHLHLLIICSTIHSLFCAFFNSHLLVQQLSLAFSRLLSLLPDFSR